FFCRFFFQAEDGIRDRNVTGVQTCALPIFNTADLVIMPSEPPKQFGSIALVQLPVWAYVAPNHPWAGRDEISLEELVEERVVVRSEERRVGKECGARRCASHGNNI